MKIKIKTTCGSAVIYSVIIFIMFSCNSNNNPYDEISSIKQKNKVVIKDTIFIYDSIIIDKSNLKAIIEVEARLKMIEIDMNSDMDYSILPEALVFLEKLTKIGYETAGGFAGPYRPKLSDYKKWSDWFEKNKQKLYWDEKEQEVKLKE